MTATVPLAFTTSPPRGPGPRRGVLLVHGLTGAPGEMRYLAKKLTREGFACHAPLLAGHGATTRELLGTTWRDWVASMVEAHDRLAKEVDEVHVAGICAGGLTGLMVAHARPTVRSASVYSPTLAHDGWAMPKWFGVARRVHPLFRLPFLRSIEVPEEEPYGIKNVRLRERVAASMEAELDGVLPAFPCGAISQQYGLISRVLKVAPALRTPVLLLHSPHDDQCRPHHAERLRDLLGGPVDLGWMHESYHMMHIDQERAEVAARTAAHIRRWEAPVPEGPAAHAADAERSLVDA